MLGKLAEIFETAPTNRLDVSFSDTRSTLVLLAQSPVFAGLVVVLVLIGYKAWIWAPGLKEWFSCCVSRGRRRVEGVGAFACLLACPTKP